LLLRLDHAPPPQTVAGDREFWRGGTMTRRMIAAQSHPTICGCLLLLLPLDSGGNITQKAPVNARRSRHCKFFVA